jgi:uncharacterized protein (DUF3820 family)
MNDRNPNIVPFGKYRGQPLEALVADQDYVQWLMAQDWFRTRFANLYQVVINHGSELAETPEHNALQVLFLEDAFCLAFTRAAVPDLDQEAIKELTENGSHELQGWHYQIGEKQRPLIHFGDTTSYEQRRQSELAGLQANIARVVAGFQPITYQFRRSFELGRPPLDVELIVYAQAANECEARLNTIRVELKPGVSDDYPAVLRQMNANRAEVLLLREYTGRGATREQFIKTFATAGKRIVFLGEVS